MESIKDKVTELYDDSGYSDKYGLHILFVFVFSLLVFLGCSYYYILNNLQPIKANWNVEKCNPVYMPFAGVIHDKKGDEFYKFTSDNFTGCIQTILEKITNYAFLPFYYAMNVISNIFLALINAIALIREMFDKIRNSASDITAVIFDRIFNIVAPILEMFINIKSMMAKFAGAMATVIFSLLGSYLALQSFVKAIIELLTKILYALLGVIVALLILSWIPGVFPIAFGFGLAMAALLGLVIFIQLNMKNILKIQSRGLPTVPGI